MTKSDNNQKPTIFLSLLIGGLITTLLIESSQPSLPILGELQGLDKIAHFFAFSCLGLLVCALSFKLRPRPAIPLFSIPLLTITLFDIIEESIQHFVPGRTAELLDFLADVSGALFAIILANWVAHLTRADKQISSD